LKDTKISVAAGESGLLQAAQEPTDWCMAAITGVAGVKAAYTALKSTNVMALATKECLVCAGKLFLATAQKYNVKIIPVDSEHNAIYQVFDFNDANSITKLILTASGGPFRTWSLQDMRNATVVDALKHPTWTMGRNISIDSATMFNKAMEVIEAHHLFNVGADKIQVVVHPESIVHSVVEYCDGSLLAQMGLSDMCIPISYALGWPKRLRSPHRPLNFLEYSKLTFEQPDTKRFKALNIAHSIIEENSNHGCVLNAAKEIAVDAFLQNGIGFLQIESTIEDALGKIDCSQPINHIDDMIALDSQTRAYVEKNIH